jgi:hypothetical protein
MIQFEVFWVVTSCSVVEGYQRFEGLCCLHLHCVVTPYNVVVGYQRFGGPCCLHLHWVVLPCGVVVGYRHFWSPCCVHLYPGYVLCIKSCFIKTGNIFAMKMEAARSSENLVYYCNTTRVTTQWRWRQQGSPKRWYPTTFLHGFTLHSPCVGKSETSKSWSLFHFSWSVMCMSLRISSNHYNSALVQCFEDQSPYFIRCVIYHSNLTYILRRKETWFRNVSRLEFLRKQSEISAGLSPIPIEVLRDFSQHLLLLLW